MEPLIAWIAARPFQTFLCYIWFMAAVQALPRPDAKSSKKYLWLFACLHLVAVNVSLVANVLLESRKAAADAAAQTPSAGP